MYVNVQPVRVFPGVYRIRVWYGSGPARNQTEMALGYWSATALGKRSADRKTLRAVADFADLLTARQLVRGSVRYWT